LFAAVFNSGAYFGPAVGGLVLAWLVSAAGWRATFLVCSAVGFVWLLAWMIWFRKPEEAGWLSAEERALILRAVDTPARWSMDLSAHAVSSMRTPCRFTARSDRPGTRRPESAWRC
jgi:MFS family permease